MGTRVVIDPDQLAAIRGEVLETIRSMRGTTASRPTEEEDPAFQLGMEAGVELVERFCDLRFEAISRYGIGDDRLGGSLMTGPDQPKCPTIG